ncbi:MAG: hypothetical protein COV79_04020 [Parcubacteria group bacterium CG11_big_fil_rev_8_21_14_0_20_41_14]|nr:MAG: hypothetical protein COV79_04020 [Parcubacteria group bacterium CG11_big_fil_rev_8_21_14_0_20_41_14]
MNACPYHLSVTVPVELVKYLEWVGLEARRSGGLRLPKASIVRALVNVLMRMEVDVSGVTTQEELEERIWAAMGRNGERFEGRNRLVGGQVGIGGGG